MSHALIQLRCLTLYLTKKLSYGICQRIGAICNIFLTEFFHFRDTFVENISSIDLESKSNCLIVKLVTAALNYLGFSLFFGDVYIWNLRYILLKTIYFYSVHIFWCDYSLKESSYIFYKVFSAGTNNIFDVLILVVLCCGYDLILKNFVLIVNYLIYSVLLDLQELQEVLSQEIRFVLRIGRVAQRTQVSFELFL